MKKILILMLILSSLAFSAMTGTTKSGYVFAIKKDQINKVIDLAASGDTQAFQTYVNRLAATGQGGMLGDGVKVYIDSTSWGLVEIRPKGEVQTFWTVREAIEFD